jgi:hypothetical protein
MIINIKIKNILSQFSLIFHIDNDYQNNKRNENEF